MLLVKYLVEDYHTLDIETRCDIYNAIKQGYTEGSLTVNHVRAVILYVYGYNVEEISHMLRISGAEYLISAFSYIESITHFSDYGAIKKHKGEVQPQWIAKAQKIAMEAW